MVDLRIMDFCLISYLVVESCGMMVKDDLVMYWIIFFCSGCIVYGVFGVFIGVVFCLVRFR